MINQVEKYLLELQKEICSEIEQIDGKSLFEIDKWARSDKRGDGVTSIITDGNVFEKGGVNFSIIHGDKMPKSATATRPELEGRKYTALGISLVMHLKTHLYRLLMLMFVFLLLKRLERIQFGGLEGVLILHLIMALMKMQSIGIKLQKKPVPHLERIFIQNIKKAVMIIFI